MSEIRVTNVLGENGNSPVNFTKGINMSGIVTATGFVPTVGQLSNRNKIINGAMTVSQQYGTSSVQLSATEYYFVDRWKNDSGSSFDMKCDASQSSEAPEGFANSMKFDCDGVSTPTGGHNGLIATFLEGQNLQDLKFGTSNAESITLSFYAKSGSQNNGHVYGVYLGAYLNGTRNSQTKGFTVTSSWQRFTMTFAGTGTAQSTAINNDTNRGMMISFSLASGPDDKKNYSTWTADTNLSGFTGQDNFFDNTSNELYITGVQLEVGTVATPFEHRSFGEELARCQRYFYRHGDLNTTRNYALMGNGMIGHNGSTDTGKIEIVAPVRMRQQPTVSVIGTDSFIIHTGGGETGTSDAIGTLASGGLWTSASSDINFWIDIGRTSGGSPSRGVACIVYANNNGANLGFSAEL